jgi:hypothetical protein
LAESDAPIYLVEAARSDLAAAVLDVSAARIRAIPFQVAKAVKASIRLWLVLKAVEATEGTAGAEFRS